MQCIVFVFCSVFRDGLSDLPGNVLSTSVAELEGDVCNHPANHVSESQQPANLSSQQQEQQQLNLMTPDAFSSPAKKDSPSDLRSPQVSLMQWSKHSKIQQVGQLGIPLVTSVQV
jgi:hypothetical protein